MPTRYIKESARTSKNLSIVSDFAERLFWRLITTADDFGRFLACPIIVRSTCFPLMESLKSTKVEQALIELHQHHLIMRYTVGDRQYGSFCNWAKHQGKPRANSSKYPDPGFGDQVHLPASVCNRGHAPADSLGNPNTNTNTDTDTNSDTDSDLKSAEVWFQEWWDAMPGRGKAKLYKAKALEFYSKYVKPDERASALLAAKAYARHCQQEDRLPVDPHRFLNGQKGQVWREFIPVAPIVQLKPLSAREPPSTGPAVPPPPEVADRLKRMGINIPGVSA